MPRYQDISETYIVDVNPVYLASNFKFWDDKIEKYQRLFEYSIDNCLINRIMHHLSYEETWKGFHKQKEMIENLVSELYVLSLHLENQAINLFLEYLTDASSTKLQSKGILTSLIELYLDIEKSWNAAIKIEFGAESLELMSVQPVIRDFLQWLTVEISFDGGSYNAFIPSQTVTTTVADIVNELKIPLELCPSYVILRNMLYLLTKQQPTLLLKLKTKTHTRFLHTELRNLNDIRKTWNTFVDEEFRYIPILHKIALQLLNEKLINEIGEDVLEENLTELNNIPQSFIFYEFPVKQIGRALDSFPEIGVRVINVDNFKDHVKSLLDLWIAILKCWKSFHESLPSPNFKWNKEDFTEFLSKLFFFKLTNDNCNALSELKQTMSTILRYSSVETMIDLHRVKTVIKLAVEKDWPNNSISDILKADEYQVLPRIRDFLNENSQNKIARY